MEQETRWGVAANVVEERLHGSDGEIRRGTKHFSPGTKVWFVDAYWGMGGERVTVLGLARRPRRWITVDLSTRVLNNWRPRLVYQPAVLERLGDAGPRDEDDARRIAEIMQAVSADERIRLVERSRAKVDLVRAALGTAGHSVLTASQGSVTRPHVERWFVLYDGAEPFAGSCLVEWEGSEPGWSELWVRADVPDALAALVAAVQQREPRVAIGWQRWVLVGLVARIRTARRRLGAG